LDEEEYGRDVAGGYERAKNQKDEYLKLDSKTQMIRHFLIDHLGRKHVPQ
jgi:hypothetical protein